MENKKENLAVSFDNLKFLSQLVNGNEISQMVTNIKKAKQTLETYYKSIKDKIKVDATKPQVTVEPSESVVTKAQVETKTVAAPARETSFVKRENANTQTI